jgi:hypothetical protein
LWKLKAEDTGIKSDLRDVSAHVARREKVFVLDLEI